MKFLFGHGKSTRNLWWNVKRTYVWRRCNVKSTCPWLSEGMDEIEFDSPPGCLTHKIGWIIDTLYSWFWQKIWGRKFLRKWCSRAPLTTNCSGRRMFAVCAGVLQQIQENDEWLNRIIAGNESWCFQHDPETKRQSLQWKSPCWSRPKKAGIPE